MFQRAPARVVAVDDVVHDLIATYRDTGFLQQAESRLADGTGIYLPYATQ